MRKLFLIFTVLTLILLVSINRAFPSERPEENQVLRVIQKMASAFKTMEDYTCEVGQLFYQNGEEDRRFRFKFYFKRQKKIRIDFSHPYSALTIFYKDGDQAATVVPFRFIPALKFRFSINNSMLKTSAGQRIDQTDMGYFIEFLFRNLKTVKQERDEYQEDKEKIKFLFWALDYIEEKNPEKYRIFVSKKHWLPIRIERYSAEGKSLETTDIKNYIINSRLDDKLFVP